MEIRGICLSTAVSRGSTSSGIRCCVARVPCTDVSASSSKGWEVKLFNRWKQRHNVLQKRRYNRAPQRHTPEGVNPARHYCGRTDYCSISHVLSRTKKSNKNTSSWSIAGSEKRPAPPPLSKCPCKTITYPKPNPILHENEIFTARASYNMSRNTYKIYGADWFVWMLQFRQMKSITACR